MTPKHALYLYGVSIFVILLSFAPEMNIGDGVHMTYPQQWKSGLSPLSIALGLVLLMSTFYANKGSKKASIVCIYWGVAYSFLMSIVLYVNYQKLFTDAAVMGLIWSAFWFYFVRKIFKDMNTGVQSH